jgi:hypothetical protein
MTRSEVSFSIGTTSATRLCCLSALFIGATVNGTGLGGPGQPSRSSVR